VVTYVGTWIDMEQLPLRLKNVTERHTTVSMDRDMEQPPQRLKDVTEQRDTLLCQQVCQGGWDKFGCKCYWLTRGWGSWNNCRKLCVTHGADLVVVDSKEEMDFISRHGNNWLGATDEASEGMWIWVDGTVLSVDNPSWRRGKPDGDMDKNCLKRIGEETNLKWTDESCEFRNLGICELNLMK
uniref:C-type lectin domain-containing protein n=1 Tax=Gadus morhua TaxID=8049 RepID=A0A8C5B2P9_GADMO